MRLAYLLPFFAADAVPGYRGRVSNRRRVYLHELSGLRGVAIMMVVCGHLLERVWRFYGDRPPLTALETSLMSQFATPFSGCVIFFCISGYSLLTFLLHETNARDRTAVAGYRGRRLFRLCPPYLLVLTATFLFLTTTGYTPVGTNQFHVQPNSLTESLLASLVFCHDLVFGTFPRLFPPGWFIEVQVQFYLIGPVLWILYLHIPKGPIRLALGGLILIPISVVSLWVLRHGPANLAHCVIAYFPYFWAGALLADFRGQDKAPSLGRPLARFPMGLCALGALIVLGEPLRNPILQLTAQMVCLAIVFQAAAVEGDSLRRVLLNRWLTRIGVASYSIFLVHLQILQILTPLITKLNVTRNVSLAPLVATCAVIGIPTVLAAALVFYWLIERPLVAAVNRGFRFPAPVSPENP